MCSCVVASGYTPTRIQAAFHSKCFLRLDDDGVTYMYVYICIYICKNNVDICICIYTCMYIYMYACISICTYI